MPAQEGDLPLPAWFKSKKRRTEGELDEGGRAGASGGNAKDANGKSAGAGGGARTNKLSNAMGRLLVSLDRDVEEIKSALYERAAMAAKHPLVESTARAGKEYNNTSKDMKKAEADGEEQDWRGRGSPHLHIFMTFTVTAVTLLRSSTESNFMDVETQAVKALQEIQNMPLRQLGLLVRVFRVRVHKATEGQEHTAHFEWAVDLRSKAGQDLYELLLRVFELQGAERTSGPAPRGPLAREIMGLTSGKK